MTYAVSEIRSAVRPRKRRLSRAAIEPWLYLSPAIVLLVVVLLVPLIIGISYSFRKFSAFKSEYVGLGQYQAMLSDAVLGQKPAKQAADEWAAFLTKEQQAWLAKNKK